MKTNCIITGCTLINKITGAWVSGDLHHQGSTYIFVANCHCNGETAWRHSDDSFYRKQVEVTQLFERRGILVFNSQDAQFNLEAREHMDKWTP